MSQSTENVAFKVESKITSVTSPVNPFGPAKITIAGTNFLSTAVDGFYKVIFKLATDPAWSSSDLALPSKCSKITVVSATSITCHTIVQPGFTP